MQKLTKEQAIVIMGYTGISTVIFSDFHKDVTERLGRQIWTHEFANKETMEEVKALYKEDFLRMLPDLENNMKKFYADWSGDSEEVLLSEFKIPESALDGVEILFAAYTYENYNGDAFVIFRKDDKLYEVNAGHCSCYGLEDQWEPEETTIKAIKHRVKTDYGFNGYKDELKAFLRNFKFLD